MGAEQAKEDFSQKATKDGMLLAPACARNVSFTLSLPPSQTYNLDLRHLLENVILILLLFIHLVAFFDYK